MGDLQALAQPSGPGDVRLDEVDGSGRDVVAEPHATVRAGLVAGDRNGYLLRYFGAPAHVVWANRLFVPVDIKGLHCPPHLHSRRHIPRPIHVHHQSDLRPDGLSHCADPRKILRQRHLADTPVGHAAQRAPLDLAVSPHLHLDRAEAVAAVAFRLRRKLRNPLPLGIEASRGVRRHTPPIPAQKPPQRHPGHLAPQVPKRDVDPAHGGDQDPASGMLVGPLVHLLPQPFDLPRILAHQMRAQLPLDDRLRRGERAAEMRGLAQPD